MNGGIGGGPFWAIMPPDPSTFVWKIDSDPLPVEGAAICGRANIRDVSRASLDMPTRAIGITVTLSAARHPG